MREVRTADTVVVGGGVMGCTVAFRLAERGQRVVLLERGGLCMQASGVNAGTLSIQIKRAVLVPYAMRGWDLWRTTRDWLGVDVGFEQVGGVTLAFTDVAQFIDPTTVSFADLTDPDGTMVLEQEFQFDLVSPSKLLEKYLDQPIVLRVPSGAGEGQLEEIRGTLLSANQGQLVVQTDNGLRMFHQGQVQPILGKVPGGLITKPTLEWLLTARRAGR